MPRALLLFLALTACGSNPDRDGDGFPASNDCVDDDPRSNPGATEVCDGIDNDCDGEVDEGVGTAYHVDLDQDGYGDPDEVRLACELTAGLVDDASDCDDGDDRVSPDADEQCDGIDNDCDGEVDEDGDTLAIYHPDTDGDGYGDPDVEQAACAAPGTDWTLDATDCDDARDTVHPGANETCNGVDDDCDGTLDEDATDAPLWYADLDADGHGDPAVSVEACSAPTAHVASADDCDDSRGDAFPGADETCNDLDDDCDTELDESAVDAGLWYADVDGDGFGDPNSPLSACEAPAGYVADSQDCDDATAEAQPAPIWYADADSDGYGDPAASLSACEAPAGYVADPTDCDDLLFDVEPGTLWFADADADGLGDPSSSIRDCEAPAGHVADDSDCDDQDAAVAGPLLWFTDADADGHGDPALSTASCVQPPSSSDVGDDCDDTNDTVNPDVAEICDGLDNDCDTLVDDGVTATETFYADVDGDGFGDPSTGVQACVAPADHVENDDDCDDADPALNPETIWYYDGDQDGFGVATSTQQRCTPPSIAYALDDGDCEPSDPNSHPGAEEICVSGTSAEARDNDCDGTVDEECPTVHCGTISADETWGPDPYGHLMTCNVFVQGTADPTLTVLPGTTVQAYPNTTLYVGYSGDGTLDAQGTESEPVVFRGLQEVGSPGDWYGILLLSGSDGSELTHTRITDAGGSASYTAALYVQAADAVLDHVEVDHSERDGIYIANSSNVQITDSYLHDNGEYGLYCAGAACLSETADSFTGNTLSGNAQPLRVYPNHVGALASDSSFVGNTDDHIEIVGGTVTTDAVWHALDAPYDVVQNSVNVQHPDDPQLVLEDGVRIRFASNAGLFIGNSGYGRLRVEGSEARVQLGSSRTNPGPGDWQGVHIGTYGTGELMGVDIRHAGSSASYPANLSVTGSAVVSDAVITDSAYHGINLNSNAEIDLSTSEIADNALYGVHLASTAQLVGPLTSSDLHGNDRPLQVPVSQTHQVDATSSFTGNVVDVVEVEHDGYLEQDVTWQALDVPYRALSSVYVGDNVDGAVLTIEDGAILEFPQSGALFVGQTHPGDLVVEGDRTTGDGVIFRSTRGQPGSWYGIVLGNYTSALTDLRGFTLREAGYSGSYAGGLHLSNADVRLSDCLIEDNERYGVYVISSNGTSHSNLEIRDCTIQGTVTTNDSTLPDGDGLFLNDNAAHEIFMDGLQSTGNDRYPLVVRAENMVDVQGSPTSDYTGNGDDRLYVHGGTARVSGTWSDPGIPWLIGNHIYVDGTDTDPAVIDVSGGTFQFGIGRTLAVGRSGPASLIAQDSTFTSSRPTPTAGDWCGISFHDDAAGSSLTNNLIAFGGATSGCPFTTGLSANITVSRTAITLDSNTLQDSASAGLFFSYSTGSDVTGNLFQDNTTSGVVCSTASSADLLGNTFVGNGSGDTDGCF